MDALVEEFFRKEEALKLHSLRERLETKKTREDLRRASCLSNDATLDELIDLGLSADAVAALSLVPLIDVAWADGEIQPAERDAILEAAGGHGVEGGSEALVLLSTWLSRGEPPELYPVWERCIRELTPKLSNEQREELKRQVVGFARDVARAAGGFLGIRSICESEDAALAKIESAFVAESG